MEDRKGERVVHAEIIIKKDKEKKGVTPPSLQVNDLAFSEPQVPTKLAKKKKDKPDKNDVVEREKKKHYSHDESEIKKMKKIKKSPRPGHDRKSEDEGDEKEEKREHEKLDLPAVRSRSDSGSESPSGPTLPAATQNESLTARSTTTGGTAAGRGVPLRKSSEGSRSPSHGLSASSLSVLPSFLRRRNKSYSADSTAASSSPSTSTKKEKEKAKEKEKQKQKERKEIRTSDGKDKNSSMPILATTSHNRTPSTASSERSPRSAYGLRRVAGFGGDKAIVISADSLMAVLEEHRPPPPPPPPADDDDEDDKKLAKAEGEKQPDWATSSFDNLSALSSSSSSDDEDNYWDDTWVPDDHEADERQQWLERERLREAKHRRREEKKRRLDERWARQEKLNCEARDRRLAEEEEERRIAASTSIMTRYGAKKTKTMIMIRSMVTRDGSTTHSEPSSPSPTPPPATRPGSGIFGMSRVRSADQRRGTDAQEEKPKKQEEGEVQEEQKKKKKTKDGERPKLVRRRSGSEADLRKYADLLTGTSPDEKKTSPSSSSSSSSASPVVEDKEKSGKKKKKTRDEAEAHDPRLRRENTVGLLPHQ